MKLTLKVKMNLAIFLSFLVIALIFTAIELPFQQQRIAATEQNIILILKTMVERDLEPLANEIFDQSIRSINIRIKKMKAVPGVIDIHVFNSSGDLIASNGARRPELKPITAFADAGQGATRIRKVNIHGVNTIEYLREIAIIGERIGFIQIHYSLAPIETEEKRAFLIFTGLLATVFIVLTVLLNLILSRTLIRPITGLRDAMERIRTQGTREYVDIQANDEIGDLAASFNHMAVELTRSYYELEKQNQALLESETEINRVQLHLKNIIDSMPSILAGVDSDGRIIHWNAQAEQFTGIPASRAIGQSYKDVLPWAGVLPQDRIKQAIEQQTVFAASKITVWQDETVHYIDITVFPLTGTQQPEGVLRLDDATDRYKMEEMMIQSEKMLSVGGLAAGMAHEINNPLAGMIQTADVLKSRLLSDLPASVKAARKAGTDIDTIRTFMTRRQIPKLLDNIHQSGVIAAGIVRNMLSFARKNERGKLMCDMAQLMDETLALARSDYNLKKKYDFKKIRIMKEYDPKIPQVPCEPGQIQQVFLNILTNGAQAMFEYKQTAPPDYVPQISLNIHTARRKTHVRIKIRDNGPGIAEHTRKRVFEPFFTTKEQGEGTGLGLSVSYFIIKENHGGEMQVESSPGFGTRFIITLPVTDAPLLNQTHT